MTGHDCWKHEDVDVGSVRLHLVRAGAGRPVILLHGFPDFWLSWRYQIAALSAAGFEAIAPDLRGYNTSEKPAGVAAYDVDLLVADIVGLADRLCGGRALLVAHDWGGIVAWYAAMQHPERFEKLVVINSPHPAAFARDFWRSEQFLRSFYMFLFQIPRLPEALIRARNFRSLERLYAREVAGRDAFAHGEVELYKRALGQPGALTSALNFYRAAFRRARRTRGSDVAPIRIPTLLLWGDRDPHLRRSLASGLEQWVPDITVRHSPSSGHWLQLDEPDFVSRELIQFLGN